MFGSFAFGGASFGTASLAQGGGGVVVVVSGVFVAGLSVGGEFIGSSTASAINDPQISLIVLADTDLLVTGAVLGIEG